jgi:hypothetical protein
LVLLIITIAASSLGAFTYVLVDQDEEDDFKVAVSYIQSHVHATVFLSIF